MGRAKAFLLLLLFPLTFAAGLITITKVEPVDLSGQLNECDFMGPTYCPSEASSGSYEFCYNLIQGPCYAYEVDVAGGGSGSFYVCKGCVLSCDVFEGECFTEEDALALLNQLASQWDYSSGELLINPDAIDFPEDWHPGSYEEQSQGEAGGASPGAGAEGRAEEAPSWEDIYDSVKEEMEGASPEEALSQLTEAGETLKETLKELLPPLKERFSSPQDVKEYLVETGAVDGETAEVLAKDFTWEEFEEVADRIGYTPLDEALLMETHPEVVRRGAREQALRKAVVKEGIEKAQQLKELMAAGAEGYKHNVGTGWSTFMKMLSLLEIASASVAGEMEVAKAAAESIVTDELDQMKNAYIGEDDLLAKGAKFALQAHHGYAEARATGLGYPPQRFLYGCAKGEYEQFKCEEGEEGGYKVVVNGEERVVSHFVRMKDKDGNIYWVGTDDPEAVDEEALESATIILKEVKGWLWKSDNVEVIDPKSGETLSEEDLPGMFG